MKRIVKDFLFGLLIIIVITIFEFIVTLPLGEPWELSPEGYSYFINRELLLTALPAALTTFIFSWLLKTKNKTDAVRRSIIWTLALVINYTIIGIGNDNFGIIFRTAGVYVLMACVFAGHVLYAKIKHLE
jgi:hypothetical protein